MKKVERKGYNGRLVVTYHGEANEIHPTHPDAKLFDSIIIPKSPSILSNDDRFELKSSSHGFTGENDASINMEGNYIRFSSSSDWDNQSISALKERFEDLNSKTSDYNFHLMGVTDYEFEPGERIYPATISFFVTQKNENPPKEFLM